MPNGAVLPSMGRTDVTAGRPFSDLSNDITYGDTLG